MEFVTRTKFETLMPFNITREAKLMFIFSSSRRQYPGWLLQCFHLSAWAQNLGHDRKQQACRNILSSHWDNHTMPRAAISFFRLLFFYSILSPLAIVLKTLKWRALGFGQNSIRVISCCECDDEFWKWINSRVKRETWLTAAGGAWQRNRTKWKQSDSLQWKIISS